MARPISEQELQLKKRARRRLVGAIVLVTTVAVVLPMVLDSEPKPVSQNVDIHIPSPDSGELKSKPPATAPSGGNTSEQKTDPAASAHTDTTGASSPPRATVLPPAGGETSAVVAQGTDNNSEPSGSPPGERKEAVASPVPAQAPKSQLADTSRKPAASTEQSRPAIPPEKSKPPTADEKHKAATAPAKSKAEATKAAAPADTAKRAPESAAASGAFVVQVAALSDAAKAKQLQKQMSGVGVKAYMEVVPTKTGGVTRVRAGPYATREAAEKARAQLKKAGLDGRVVQR